MQNPKLILSNSAYRIYYTCLCVNHNFLHYIKWEYFIEQNKYYNIHFLSWTYYIFIIECAHILLITRKNQVVLKKKWKFI